MIGGAKGAMGPAAEEIVLSIQQIKFEHDIFTKVAKKGSPQGFIVLQEGFPSGMKGQCSIRGVISCRGDVGDKVWKSGTSDQ